MRQAARRRPLSKRIATALQIPMDNTCNSLCLGPFPAGSEPARRLMMMSGSGASTCPMECGRAATSRLTEVSTPPSQRDIASPADRARNCEIRSGRLPLERRAVDPDAAESHGDPPGNGGLRLLRSDPLCELHSRGLEGGPFLGPIKQNGCRLEQVVRRSRSSRRDILPFMSVSPEDRLERRDHNQELVIFAQ